MLEEIEISLWLEEKFDLIIDARSPREYKESHIPKSVNFYALNNHEYEQTGKIYKNDKFAAKVYGASCVCKNITYHLNDIQKICDLSGKVGIYCAKGGMRSTSIATVLSMIGYRVYKIKNGYKAYRRYVLDYLNSPCKCKFITLFGNTGCGKTKLIDMLYPCINLEKLANHLGSTFGCIKGKQPSQKTFENQIFTLLRKFEYDIVFIEGESAKLGNIIVPKSLNSAIHECLLSVNVTAPIKSRISTILSDYEKIDDEFFYKAMQKITPFIKKEAKLKALKDYEDGNLCLVAENLLLNYYDNVYKKPKKIDFILDNKEPEKSIVILNKLRQDLLNRCSCKL